MMGAKLGSPLARFERAYIPEPNSGCWIWLGAVRPHSGHGIFYFPPKNMVSAHRAAWRLFRGSPRKKHVLHTCDMACCVNPEHLYLGTHQDNMRDRDARHRRRAPKGTLNGRAQVTEVEVAAIRSDPRPPRFVTKDYPNIPFSTLQKIRNRQTWKHLP